MATKDGENEWEGRWGVPILRFREKDDEKSGPERENKKKEVGMGDVEKRPITNEVVRILETALKYQVPPPPPPPLPPARSKNYNVSLPPPPPDNSNVPLPPPHSGVSSSASINQRPLKPLQLMKTNAKEGSLWNVSQKHGIQSRAPEIDITELESLFLTASMSTGAHKDIGQPGSEKLKPENICLVKPLRASTWEIMLGKINLPLPDIIKAILSLDSSAMSVHQLYNLIEFCPTKEEMEIVKSYTGYKKMLGQCEQFFLECAKIPRIKPKLRVFAFTITFSSQVNNLSESLTTIKDATKEIMESTKLVKIMQIIFTMGNKLNACTTEGSTGGFRLDNFRNLGYTYATDKKITLLHYLCKVVAEQTPVLLDFDKDLIHLQSASMIQIKSWHEDKYAIINGFEKAQNEFDASDNDGDVSARFREALKSFLDSADDQLPPLTSSFNEVAQYADSLAVYFGEDPSCVPWEQVITSLVRFVVKFKKAHNENLQREDSEMKKIGESC
ncbi:unnamed protein product [Lactuca virosa]|uniref:Formin-like protein n=1 Tax=Lactuca virosa TaxID=75947 RepID=A0AAU9MQ01_9ASTR|nr:unnamed protein product [Lactuca virosa]